MNTDKLEVAISRVERIRWGQDDPAQGQYYVQLVKEFLRRSAQWAERIGTVDRWPLTDIGSILSPDVKRHDPRIIAAIMDCHVRAFIAHTLVCYLHWAAIEDGIVVPGVTGATRVRLGKDFQDLQPPFEPLIVAYEHGLTDMSRDDVFIQVGMTAISVSDWTRFSKAAAFVNDV